MSDLVLPSLPGLAFPGGRTAVWKGEKTETLSGRTFRNTRWTYPRWLFRMKYEFLRQRQSYPSFHEYEDLVGFFNNLAGPHDTFLFTDPEGSSVTAQQTGTGNGSTKLFALQRLYGGHLEPIGKTNGAITVTVNGVSTSAYTLVDGRLVEFDSAPANGAVIGWTGAYYLRCEFVDDELDAEQFMAGLYSSGIEFQTWKP